MSPFEQTKAWWADAEKRCPHERADVYSALAMFDHDTKRARATLRAAYRRLVEAMGYPPALAPSWYD